jgi:hypothetical protein
LTQGPAALSGYRCLADEAERRAMGRQHNKTESLHALHEWLFHCHHGTARLHTLERPSVQAHCLHLVANAAARARRARRRHTVDQLAGLTPTLFEHINPLGTYTFDTDRPAGQLRPLRAPQVAA